ARPASCLWIAATLLYLRCAKKSRQDQSALCAACCLLTSLCDTVGAVLARQLTIQVFTGAYLAAVDLVNFMFILFPVCGSKFKSNSDREARERKRRRQLRASVFALALPLSLGPCWALWVAAPKASATIRGPQRRLLASLLQENTEILGYLLGSIAAFGSWASRIPPLSRICRGKTFPSIHLWTRLLSALAGLLYASAIVAHDRQPEYLLRATPWFLTSLGRAALDLAVFLMLFSLRRADGFIKEELPTQARSLTGEHREMLGCTPFLPPGCQVMDRRALEMRCCRSPHRTLPFRSSGPECLPAAPLRSPPSTPTWRYTAVACWVGAWVPSFTDTCWVLLGACTAVLILSTLTSHLLNNE
uniref:Transmembrane protein 44 n=1 Tax=Macaca nemestrina TaxID=9545 RepID=A0A2K6DC23_MACNE